jgi:CRISPR-associated protein Csm2
MNKYEHNRRNNNDNKKYNQKNGEEDIELRNGLHNALKIENNNVLEIIDFAEKIGKKKLIKIPSSKLRKFYDYINDIDVNEENDKWFVKFAFIKPKIAYNIGKEKDGNIKDALRYLHKLVSIAIDDIDKSLSENRDEAVEKFRNFKKFFEAVVAYHRTKSRN